MPDGVELTSRFESLKVYDDPLEQGSDADFLKSCSGTLSEYIQSVLTSIPNCDESTVTLPSLPPERYRVIPKQEFTQGDVSECNFRYSPEDSLVKAKICEAKRLSLKDSLKPVWHFEVEPNSSVHYSPGDAFGFFIENDSHLVSWLLHRFNVTYNLYVVDTKTAPPKSFEVSSALRKQFDLFSPPKKSLLRLLGEFCVDDRERRILLLLSSDVGRDTYRSLFIRERVSLLDLLVAFPSCEPPLEKVLDGLPFLMPRYYSASSCYESKENTIDFVFSLAQYNIIAGKRWTRKGHATGTLDRICTQWDKRSLDDVQLTIFHRPSNYFRPPENLDVPYLMVCAGTGLAPFRGFIQQRRRKYTLKTATGDYSMGQVYLFFGCRQVGEFQWYLDEIENDMSMLPNAELFVCYSRSTDDAMYVQDLLKKHAEQVNRLICSHPSSRIYVCGDGANMAKGVQESLSDILSEYHCSNKEDAKKFLKKLSDEKRYVQDIWFWG